MSAFDRCFKDIGKIGRHMHPVQTSKHAAHTADGFFFGRRIGGILIFHGNSFLWDVDGRAFFSLSILCSFFCESSWLLAHHSAAVAFKGNVPLFKCDELGDVHCVEEFKDFLVRMSVMIILACRDHKGIGVYRRKPERA